MNGYGLLAVVIESAASLAWPVALVICVWFLRDEIRKLLPTLHVRHGETEVGFKRIGELVDQVQVHEAKEVAAQISQPNKKPSIATADLSQLSANELRLHVEDVALKMRELEQRFHADRDRDLRNPNRNWEESTARLLENSTQQRKEWQTTLQPEAKALKDELVARLGGEDAVDLRHTDATFDLGMLAGPYPLNEAALVLEQLARRLSGPSNPSLTPIADNR
jgi:hypothetical protein